MLTIRVSSLSLAPRLSVGWADQVISLLDPDIRLPIPSHTDMGVREDNHLISFFDDVGNPFQRGDISPSFEQIQSIFLFIRRDARVLVHCHGGISRSPAVAIGLLIARGINPRMATRAIFSQNFFGNEGSFMQPNELILTHVDRFLGLNNSLVSIVREEMTR